MQRPAGEALSLHVPVIEATPNGTVCATKAHPSDLPAIGNRYLQLMEEILINAIYQDRAIDPWSPPVFDHASADTGLDWPHQALTMIGRARLRSLRECCETVLERRVPGDFVETGIWRGGACIMMAAVLAAYGRRDRKVWGFDSFEGLPPPNEERYPQGSRRSASPIPAIGSEPGGGHRELPPRRAVERPGAAGQRVVQRYGAGAAIERIAILRLDGDLYESTIQVLEGFIPSFHRAGFASSMITGRCGAAGRRLKTSGGTMEMSEADRRYRRQGRVFGGKARSRSPVMCCSRGRFSAASRSAIAVDAVLSHLEATNPPSRCSPLCSRE